MSRPPPTSPLFPYTTLFRSVGPARDVSRGHEVWHAAHDVLLGKRALERPLDELVLVARAGRRHEHVALGGECCERRFFDEARRSEEHTSELQSQSNLVCRLL